MTKYDFEVDLRVDSSTGMVLNKIPLGCKVLEFGCAAGRMTRYMKNALDCQVYIVEYDREAFESAMQYAVDGVCDDILELSWADRFKEIEFDVILFVDVLEHLLQPALALSNAAKLLKEHGKIYVSIPNIAHNDVLLKAFDNRFDYTNVGLLDNTHVHFWGYENIAPFAESNGLSVHSIEATYRPTGTTEQTMNESFNCPPVLLNYFKERQFAEAYQFVIELGKEKEEKFDNEKFKKGYRKNAITSHLYVDDGSGFSAENVIAFSSENTTAGRYVAHYVVDCVQNVKKLRFDPLEGQGCIIQNLSVRQAGKELKSIYLNYLTFSEGILMLGTDPMILIDLPESSDPVVIDADIIIYGEEYLELVQQVCVDKNSEVQDLNRKLECFIGENRNLHGEVDHLNVENIKLQREAESLNAENVRLQGETAGLNAENTRLQGENADIHAHNKKLQDDMEKVNAENRAIQGELGGYILLANEKDRLLLSKDEQLVEQSGLLSEKDSRLLEQENLLLEKDGRLLERDNLLLEKDSRLLEQENLLLEKDNLLCEKDELLSNQNSYITQLENKVDYYKNRKCIILFDRFWKIYWAIRLKLRKLVRKREDA